MSTSAEGGLPSAKQRVTELTVTTVNMAGVGGKLQASADCNSIMTQKRTCISR
jgi:hypothetical protein